MNKTKNEFNPFILGICCNWCTYAGADQAGTSRMQRPANLRIMRVMCGGRVEPQFILDALVNGADGVLVSHCHKGDSHYVTGNYKTFGKMALLDKYLEQYGINPKRVYYTQISASEGAELTETVEEFVHILKELGPNPIKKEAN
jgi:F420-non-reducing hydrogenase iron-sulfur subunit